MFETSSILDVNVHRVTAEVVREQLDSFVQSGQPHQIVTVNMDFLRLARTDTDFRNALNGADLSVPDGVPVLWAARLLGKPLADRVTGIDIVEHGAALAAERGYRVFLLGAEPGVAAAAAAELSRRHPGLWVAGVYSPPFGPMSEEANAHMVRMVRDARPDMLFVAFGAPRQDTWIAHHRHELGVPVMVGVGGTFNFLAGRVSRAPTWMQRRGLEWLYRLKQEPRRLWKRYLLGDMPVFLRIVLGRVTPTAPLRRRLLGSRAEADA